MANVASSREMRPRSAASPMAKRWLPRSPAAAEVASSFRPDWKLPAGEFRAWHSMVVERGDVAFHYALLVVLLDAGCFSATDVFLGGFKGLPGVTLLGTASGGGSGRSRSYVLPNSGLEVRLSSMASFLPDGSRYDGKDIAPDVVVEPVLTDLTGETDGVLDAALARLR